MYVNTSYCIFPLICLFEALFLQKKSYFLPIVIKGILFLNAIAQEKNHSFGIKSCPGEVFDPRNPKNQGQRSRKKKQRNMNFRGRLPLRTDLQTSFYEELGILNGITLELSPKICHLSFEQQQHRKNMINLKILSKNYFSIKQHKNGQLVKFAWKSRESCQKPASQN